MKDFFYEYAMSFDISDLNYDVELKYYNPKSKEKPEYKTLSEMGFPYDVEKAPSYYNYAISREFYDKINAHWKRKLPAFKDRYLDYLLVFESREKAFEMFFEDCEPYGISQEEAEYYLKEKMLYYLDAKTSLEVIKEFIYLIFEYAPAGFDYFVGCYGLKNAFVYKNLIEAAFEILEIRINLYDLTPRVIQREIIKGTPLIDIYKNIFENKEAIKRTVKAFSSDELDSMPYGYYERKIERILLSQSKLDYKIGETKEGTFFDYCLYSEGEFLFAIKYDKNLFSFIWDDDYCVVKEDESEYNLDEFERAIEKIKAFDNECLEKGIAVYHISDLSLDELDIVVSSDIRKTKNDLNYLKDIIKNGTQYSLVRNLFNDTYEDVEL